MKHNDAQDTVAQSVQDGAGGLRALIPELFYCLKDFGFSDCIRRLKYKIWNSII